MKIFKVSWNKKLPEFPMSTNFCIVCAENKEEAKSLALEGYSGARKVKVSEVPTKTPRVIFHDFTEVE